MMGPYCRFCDTRCFSDIAQMRASKMPSSMRAALSDERGSYTLLAQCHAGRALDKEKTGFSFADVYTVTYDDPEPTLRYVAYYDRENVRHERISRAYEDEIERVVQDESVGISTNGWFIPAPPDIPREHADEDGQIFIDITDGILF